MHPRIGQRVERGEAAARFRHLGAALDQEVVVHPDRRARLRRAGVGLVLRDLVGVVDLAMIDPAGMDVELAAEHLQAHRGAFEVPARRADAPGRRPFHLAVAGLLRPPPDREVGRVALAVDAVDPADLGARRLVAVAGQPPVIGNGGRVEIEAGRRLVGGAGDALAKGDHLVDIVGGYRPLRRLAHVEPGEIGLEQPRVMIRHVAGGAPLGCGGLLHLVVAGIRVRGEVADIGDVYDVAHRKPLPAQRPGERVGEDIGAHVAEMLPGIDGRPARIDAHVGRIERDEGFAGAGQAVEQR